MCHPESQMLRYWRDMTCVVLLGAGAGAQESALREAARLDAEGKCEQAEPYYRQALAKGPPSAALLNNAGNHYLSCGQPDKAQQYFEGLLKTNPSHANANLQMARIATEKKQGALALQHLDRVRETSPAITMLRAEALHLVGQDDAAARLLNGLQKEARDDQRLLYALGMTAARIGRYETAESALTSVAERIPADFDVLFSLGRAASRAGHYEHAAGALEAALRLRPADVAALLELGLAHAGRKDFSRAVFVLAQARQRAPKNPDVLLALAHAAEDAGFLGDAALVYDEYLALRPGDERARLDRARVYCLTGTRLNEGLKELESYVARHPSDPAGHFTLAQFTWQQDPRGALDRLAKTLVLDPGSAPAHFARAWLLQHLGRDPEALPHLLATVKILPDNVRALDRLGVVYLSLDRPAEAKQALERALSLDPADREALMHMSQALMALDREAEARQYLERFQKTPAPYARDPRTEAGMIELATLNASESARRQIDRLRKQAGEHADQPELLLRLAELLLANGRWDEAKAAFGELAARNADSRIWEEAGTALVRAERYEPAIEFLKRALPARPAASLDLAIATSFTAGADEALRVLEQVPQTGRDGDYLLLEARLLDAAGRKAEAERALQAGLRLSVSRPQVAQQAALALLRQDRRSEALALLDHAIQAAPSSADLSLMRAVVLGLLRRFAEAETALKAIQSRWPEWDRAYLAHGLLLEEAGRKTDSRRKLETALALNPQDAVARCAWARLSGAASPEVACRCQAGLEQLLAPPCGGGQ